MCFYDEIHDELAKVETDAVILNPDLDGSGGKPKLKESSKKNRKSVFLI